MEKSCYRYLLQLIEDAHHLNLMLADTNWDAMLLTGKIVKQANLKSPVLSPLI